MTTDEYLMKYGDNGIHYNIDDMVYSKNPNVRQIAASNPLLMPHHMDELSYDSDLGVRR